MSSFYGEGFHLNLLRGCLNDGACPLWGNGCWAQGMAARLAGRAGYPRERPFAPHRLNHVRTFNWCSRMEKRKPSVVALNFMGDIACQPTDAVFFQSQWCGCYPQHTFLWLTKRPALLREKLGDVRLPSNVWLGVSALNQAMADELIPALLAVPAAHHWLSIEPMWGPINLPDKALTPCSCFATTRGHAPIPHPDCADKARLDWVVVGCQSGRGAKGRWGRERCGNCGELAGEGYEARQPDGSCVNDPGHRWYWEMVDWTIELRNQCRAASVPFHVKQLPIGGSVVSDIEAFPEDLRIKDRPWKGAQ